MAEVTVLTTFDAASERRFSDFFETSFRFPRTFPVEYC